MHLTVLLYHDLRSCDSYCHAQHPNAQNNLNIINVAHVQPYCLEQITITAAQLNIMKIN